MSSDVAIAFTELFFGSGAWLGLLLFLAIIVILSLKSRLIGVVLIPVTVFLGISYLDYPTLMWHAIIMFVTTLFILVNMVKGDH